MKILKQENWWIWLILAILSGGTSYLVLAALLDIYDKEAWYFRWTKKCPKWMIAMIGIIIALTSLYTMISFTQLGTSDITAETILTTSISPMIMILGLGYFLLNVLLIIFYIQIICQVNAKLKTPGSEIYLSPYIWIICMIVPIIGWIMLIVMGLYLSFWYLVMLYRGEGEKYIQ